MNKNALTFSGSEGRYNCFFFTVGLKLIITEITEITFDVFVGCLVLLGEQMHHISLHESAGPEQRKTSGCADNAAKRMLGGLLQPMGEGVLKLLVPHYGT